MKYNSNHLEQCSTISRYQNLHAVVRDDAQLFYMLRSLNLKYI